MRLLLIRHGQTHSNVAGALDTAFPGAVLTPLGEAQAAAIPGVLPDLVLGGERSGVRGIYASRPVRTGLTAAPLAAALQTEVTLLDGLEEIAAGDLEMRSDHDSVQAYGRILEHWMAGDLDRHLPGGHSGHAFLERYDRAVEQVVSEHGDDPRAAAIFTHGAAIRVWSTVRGGLSPREGAALRIMNTGMAVLDGDPDQGWTLTSWHTEPLGGLELEDAFAEDVTGASARDVAEDGVVDGN